MYESELQAIAGQPRKVVGPHTTLTEDSYVNADPRELSRAAGIDLDLYSAARLGESEHGGGHPGEILAVIEAARNRLDIINRQRAGESKPVMSLTRMLTLDTSVDEAGKYGRQHGRWASTAMDPTQRSIEAARIALLRYTNMAGGAYRFFSPGAQDHGIQAGHLLKYDALGIIQKWYAEGLLWLRHAPLYDSSVGVDPYRLAIMGKGDLGTNLSDAMDMIHRGRMGLHPKGQAPGP